MVGFLAREGSKMGERQDQEGRVQTLERQEQAKPAEHAPRVRNSDWHEHVRRVYDRPSDQMALPATMVFLVLLAFGLTMFWISHH